MVREKDPKAADGSTIYGGYREVTETITLDSSAEVPEFRKAECFLHEILHFLDDRDKLELGKKTVRRLAVGLMSIIRENGLDFRKPE